MTSGKSINYKNEGEIEADEEVFNPLNFDHDRIKGRKGRPSGRSNIDRRRQVHVKCEHRRRREIQDALQALEAELPITSKNRSKGAIVVESAEMIKELTFALDHLLNENQALLNRVQVKDLTK